jgi:hypothetical protein
MDQTYMTWLQKDLSLNLAEAWPEERFPDAEFYIFNYETDVLYTLGSDGQWYSSREDEISSRLFVRPLTEYIYVPEEY